MYRDQFAADVHIRRCDRCCGNCKHFSREWEDSACTHPKQAEYPSWPEEFEDESPHFSAYTGTLVDEGMVCDLWERGNEEA